MVARIGDVDPVLRVDCYALRQIEVAVAASFASEASEPSATQIVHPHHAVFLTAHCHDATCRIKLEVDNRNPHVDFLRRAAQSVLSNEELSWARTQVIKNPGIVH